MKSKIMKRVGLILACICMIGSLNGCAKFDASAYVKAILDNSYLNDSTEFVEQKIGTAEEAAELYKQGIDAEMDAMLASVTLSYEVQEAYREFYENMFQKVKYTVGEATKIDKNTIEVTVTYEKMNIFASAMAAYETAATELMAEWSTAALTGSEPTEQEMMDTLFLTLRDCMQAALDTATYEEPKTTTIKVELIDNVWTPNQDDLVNFETILFDFEGLGA